MKKWENAKVIELAIEDTMNLASVESAVDEVVYIDGDKFYKSGTKDGSGTPDKINDYTGM